MVQHTPATAPAAWWCWFPRVLLQTLDQTALQGFILCGLYSFCQASTSTTSTTTTNVRCTPWRTWSPCRHIATCVVKRTTVTIAAKSSWSGCWHPHERGRHKPSCCCGHRLSPVHPLSKLPLWKLQRPQGATVATLNATQQEDANNKSPVAMDSSVHMAGSPTSRCRIAAVTLRVHMATARLDPLCTPPATPFVLRFPIPIRPIHGV